MKTALMWLSVNFCSMSELHRSVKLRSGEVMGGKLKLRMPPSAEVTTPLKHVVEEAVAL
jgi:hypothetical protein